MTLLVCSLVPSLASAIPRSAAAHDGAHREIENATQALAREPKSFDLLLRRAELRRISGDLRGAESDLEAARVAGPGRPEIDLPLAALAMDRGRYAEALRAVDRRLAAVPEDANALRLRGRIHLASGTPERAARDFSLALARGPVTPDQYLERAAAERAAGVPLGRILRGLEEGIERLGPVVGLVFPAIDADEALGRWDAARGRLERLGSSFADVTLLERRARLLARAGRPREARLAYAATLAEIESMPSPRRSTPALRSIEARIRRALAPDVR